MSMEPQNDERVELNAADREQALSLGRVPVCVYLAVVVMLAVALNFNTLHNVFHPTDIRLIIENRNIETPSLLFRSLAVDPSRAMLTFTLAYNLWLAGPDPVWFHIVNIAVHAAVCALVFLLVLHIAGISRDLTRGTMSPRVAAFLAAALFACHPLNSETVNYISARSSSMATAFCILGLLSFIGYTAASERHTVRFWYTISILSLLLGIGSNEIAVALPVLLLIYDFLYVSRFEPSKLVRRLTFPHGPYWAIVTIVLAFRWARFGAIGMAQPVRPVWTNLMTQAHVVLNYLQLALVPVGLTVEHSVPEYSSLFDPTTLVAVGTIGAVVMLAVVFARNMPACSFGVLWYFVTLVPSSSVVPLATIMSEHRTYLPLSGLVVLAPAGIAALVDRRAFKEHRREVGAGVVVLMAALSAATVARNRVWHDELSLWSDAAGKSPASATAQTNFGQALVLRGHVQKGLAAIERAVELDPRSADARTALGLAMERLGRFDESLAAHRRAIELAPADPRVHYRYGLSLEAAGRLDDAVEQYRHAIALDPGMAEVCVRLGSVYNNMGNLDEAVRAFEGAIETDPELEYAQRTLREMYVKTGLLRKEKARLTETVEKGTDAPEPYLRLGVVYVAEGELDRAEKAFLAALDRHPSFGPALINLGNIYMQQGRVDEAVLLYQRAAQTDSHAVQAYTALVQAYAATDREQDAFDALDALEKVSGKEFPTLRERIAGRREVGSSEF